MGRLARGWPALLALVFLADAHGDPTEATVRPASPDPWQPGRPLAIEVKGGRASFQIPRSDSGSQTLVIVSALSRDPGPFPIRLSTRLDQRSSPMDLEPPRPSRSPRLGATRVPDTPVPTRRMPPPTRTFHLMVKEGSVVDASRYLAVSGQLRAVGRRVQVYVDAKDSKAVDEATLRDIVATFDEKIYPSAATRFGPAADVDDDSRFTILMTGWLSRLSGGQVSVDGFVRGADLDRAMPSPFGNRCDMMYLNAGLKAGPHLRTILAHEYTHAVTFSRKSLAEEGRGFAGPEEEGWLDESFSHLFEDSLGFSRSNIDYRVSAFLSQPERYRLVVDDYYAANLFRSHGNRGATYLFLRWCVDRYGPGLLDELVRSKQRGVENLEAATGSSFADLFRRWTVALYLGGLDPKSAGDDDGYRSIDPRGELEDWILAGPRAVTVAPDRGDEAWKATGTSAHYCLVPSGPGVGSTVEVAGPPGAEVQVTAIRLPTGLGRQELTVRSTTGPDGMIRVRARVAEMDGRPIRLGALAWEPLVPASNPQEAGFRRGGLDALGIAEAFGTSALPPRAALRSQAIPLAGVRKDSGPIVFKAIGTDQLGRRVAAWTVLDPSARPERASRDDLD